MKITDSSGPEDWLFHFRGKHYPSRAVSIATQSCAPPTDGHEHQAVNVSLNQVGSPQFEKSEYNFIQTGRIRPNSSNR